MGTSYLIKEETLQSIADSIRQKMEESVQIAVSDFADKILKIETGTDTSDATATAADLASDKTAYVDGEKIVGELPNLVKFWQEDSMGYTMTLSGDTNVANGWSFNANFTTKKSGIFYSGETFAFPVTVKVSGMVPFASSIEAARNDMGMTIVSEGGFYRLRPNASFSPEKQYCILGKTQRSQYIGSTENIVEGDFVLVNLLGTFKGTMSDYTYDQTGALIVSGERSFTISGINGEYFLAASGGALLTFDPTITIESVVIGV